MLIAHATDTVRATLVSWPWWLFGMPIGNFTHHGAECWDMLWQGFQFGKIHQKIPKNISWYASYISICHRMNPVWYILCSFHVKSIAKSGVLSTPCAPHNSSLLERLDLGVYITTSWDRCVSLPRLCQLATVAKNQMSTREGDSVCGFDVGLMLVFGSPAHSTCCLL